MFILTNLKLLLLIYFSLDFVIINLLMLVWSPGIRNYNENSSKLYSLVGNSL